MDSTPRHRRRDHAHHQGSRVRRHRWNTGDRNHCLRLRHHQHLLGKLGYHPKAYQENQRQSFLLDGAQLEIDSWPRIPPYLEIEAANRQEVLRIAALLGYTEDQLTAENTTKIYAHYGIDLTTITDLRLTHKPTPATHQAL